MAIFQSSSGFCIKSSNSLALNFFKIEFMQWAFIMWSFTSCSRPFRPHSSSGHLKVNWSSWTICWNSSKSSTWGRKWVKKLDRGTTCLQWIHRTLSDFGFKLGKLNEIWLLSLLRFLLAGAAFWDWKEEWNHFLIEEYVTIFFLLLCWVLARKFSKGWLFSCDHYWLENLHARGCFLAQLCRCLPRHLTKKLLLILLDTRR